MYRREWIQRLSFGVPPDDVGHSVSPEARLLRSMSRR